MHVSGSSLRFVAGSESTYMYTIPCVYVYILFSFIAQKEVYSSATRREARRHPHLAGEQGKTKNLQ